MYYNEICFRQNWILEFEIKFYFELSIRLNVIESSLKSQIKKAFQFLQGHFTFFLILFFLYFQKQIQFSTLGSRKYYSLISYHSSFLVVFSRVSNVTSLCNASLNLLENVQFRNSFLGIFYFKVFRYFTDCGK